MPLSLVVTCISQMRWGPNAEAEAEDRLHGKCKVACACAMEKRPANSWGLRRCALLVAAGGGWTSRALLSDPSGQRALGQRLRGRWVTSDRCSNLEKAHRDGLFQVRDRFDAGAELGEEEMSWTREYGESGSFPFWSLGQPKAEIRRLAAALEEASGDGLAAVVLGCGLGLDVSYLAKAGKTSSLTAVAGVDFAWPAIQAAGCFFHHFDVCELPAPTVPLDLIIDNTVFQNVHRSGRFEAYLESLCRISTPGHTVLHLNLMSREGMEAREEFAESMEYLNLPLLRRKDITTALKPELWEIWEVREGQYDLKPEGAGFECSLPALFGLLRGGASFDAQNLKGQTPLHLACGNGALALARLLLSARADPRLGDLSENQVPAMVATLQRASWWSGGPDSQSLDISDPASAHPASELAASKSWQRPTGYLEARLVTAEVCLQAMEEWDPDFPAAASLLNSRGETALHIAASAGDLELCRLLVSFQASVNDAESGSGLTPLMCAVSAGASEVVRQLIIAKADLHLRDATSRSALHHAAACGDTAVRDAAELLKWRAEANASDSEGATPLMLAATLGAPEMMRFLLKQGASPQVCRAMLPNISHNASLEILRGIL
ncbi:ANK2 [Symbiodinium sp. CCMP2592]|nr:ANK2 [Symbiodinium sp. CCMP2592]